MGHVTCGARVNGRECGRRMCWACDRCPRCDGCGPLQRGDYCAACTRRIIASGGRWSEYHGDYIQPEAGDVQPGQPSLFPDVHGRGGGLTLRGQEVAGVGVRAASAGNQRALFPGGEEA